MSFSDRLQERRKSLGITQVQLACLLNVSKGAIGNYESGLSSPKAEVLYKLFDVLKCDANFLFQDEMQDLCIEKSPAIAEAEAGDQRLSEIINIYNDMNEDGKEHLHDTAVMCADNPKYKKSNQSKKLA